jgi:hypothetical protein
MRNYDDEYFFVHKADDKRLPSATANDDTVERNYTFEVQQVGAAPFVFFNGSKEYDRKLGVVSPRELPDVLFNGNNLLVRTAIRDDLIQLDVPGLQMHPSVFIDDRGHWHEDYWFLIFPNRFDCWDREESDYEEEPLELGGYLLHSVYTYRLNSDLLDNTPIEQRLLFKMGGTQDGFIVCHQQLAHVFRKSGNLGATLVPVSTY